MAVTVKIPTQLREATDGESSASVDGTTVGEVLDALYDRYGELRSRIAEDGGLRRCVNVYVGGEDIRFLDGSVEAVEEADVFATHIHVHEPAQAAVLRHSAAQLAVTFG